jgi:hypothetical protein
MRNFNPPRDLCIAVAGSVLVVAIVVGLATARRRRSAPVAPEETPVTLGIVGEGR